MERLATAMCSLLAEGGRRMRRDVAASLAATMLIVVAALTVFAGLVTLIIWSFAGLWQFPQALPENLTLRNWMHALPAVATPLLTTFEVAVFSTAIATAITILCLVREDRTQGVANNRTLLILYLPLLVPQAAFLFGLQLLFIATGMQASLTALVFVHLIFVMPYVFLSLSDPWRAFDNRNDAIAAGLGRSRLAALWTIRLPMLLRAILTAAAVGFAVSVGQYLPTVLIGAGRLTTVTTEAVALAAGGNRRVIGVYAFIQMILPLAAFLIATAVPALLFRNRKAMRV
jgi:putative thiamine transport system permease protein